MRQQSKRYEKKKTPIGMFAVLFVVIMVLMYYVAGLYKLSGVNLANVQENLEYIFMHPLANWYNAKTITWWMIGLVCWILFITYYQYNFRNFHFDIEHGSAEWMDPEEATRELADKDEKNNRILTEHLKVSLEGALANNNVIVLGSSGDFKTTSYFEQNLLQFASTYIMLDIKGTTQAKLGNAFLKQGYKVQSLNLKDPELSDQYDPFWYIETEDDLLRVVDGLVSSCRQSKDGQEMSSKDPYWEDATRYFFYSLFYYEWLDSRDKKRQGNLNNVVSLTALEGQMLEDGETSKLQNMIEKKRGEYGSDYPPVRFYDKFKNNAGETLRCVMSMVNTMLAKFETAPMKRIFAGNDFNFREIATGVGGDPDKKHMIFLIVPDYNLAYNFLIAMFYTQLFDILLRVADTEFQHNNGALPGRVEVFADEIYNGASPKDMDVLLGTIRSRNICMHLGLQSIAQLKVMYPNEKYATIMDNVATILFYGSGPGADGTQKWISELLDDTTIDSRDDSTGERKNNLSFKRTGRKLMRVNEVREMQSTEGIVLLKGYPPIIDTKAIPFPIEKIGFEPDPFLAKRYREVTSLGLYKHPVYTVYDPIHLHYITVDRQKPIQVVSPEEARKYQEVAKYDPSIYEYTIDEQDLLYLSWGAPKKTQAQIQKLYREAMKQEELSVQRLRGLTVLQDIPEGGAIEEALPRVDKSNWDTGEGLGVALNQYWDKLSLEEQEQFSLALNDGLTEEQLCRVLLLPLEEMASFVRAYKAINRQGK